MPGFNIGGDGNGKNGANATAEFKRKHRWKFKTLGGLKQEVSVYLVSAQRPHFVAEEVVVHHNQEQMYLPGKQHWEPITLSFYDIQTPEDASQEIWKWVNETFKIKEANVAIPTDFKKKVNLEMTDGKGTAIEEWTIYNCWPIDVNWNDLDYSNSEVQTIDVQMKYDRAELVVKK
jgi:hypothetical protein